MVELEELMKLLRTQTTVPPSNIAAARFPSAFQSVGGPGGFMMGGDRPAIPPRRDYSGSRNVLAFLWTNIFVEPFHKI